MQRSGLATVGVCIALAMVFVLELAVARGGFLHIPASLLSDLGGNAPSLTRGDREYWRLVSALYLHGGLIHVAMNMYALFIIGSAVEAALGAGWMLGGFVVSGVAGSLLSMVGNRFNAVSIGASGGIFGLIAMAAALTWLLPGQTRFARDVLIQWIIFGLVLGFVAGFDNWGHIGGVAGGVLVGLGYAMLKNHAHGREVVGRVAGVVAIAVSLVGVGAALVSYKKAQQEEVRIEVGTVGARK